MLSSSSLSLLESTCPRALDFMEDGAPRDSSVFDVGTAAHAVMEEIQRESVRLGGVPLTDEQRTLVSSRTVASLTLNGRSFRGNHEPPMPLASALEGQRIALSYIRRQHGRFTVSPVAMPERELSFDGNFSPCSPKSKDRIWSAILDRLEMDYDEDTGQYVLSVIDLKTAWPAGQKEVESLQLKGQAVLALAHAHILWPENYTDIGVVKRKIINLRTGKETSAQNYTDDPELNDWRQTIKSVSRNAPKRDKKTNQRPSSPGLCCARCPYRNVCSDSASPDDQDQTISTQYRLHLAETKRLEKILREQLKDVTVPPDHPGYKETVKTEVLPDAGLTVLEALLPQYGDDGTLTKILTTLVSVSGLQSLAKTFPQLTPESVLQEVTSSRWGSGE